MSDFLSRLASRSLGLAPVVEPVIPAMASPLSGAEGSLGFREVTEERPAAITQNPDAPIGADQPPPPEAQGPASFQNSSGESSLPARRSSHAPRAAENTAPEAAPDSARTRPATRPVLPEQPELTLPRWDGATAQTAAPTSGVHTGTIRRDPVRSERDEPVPIRVTIGRIEVRAEFPSSQARPAAASRSKPSTLSLESYLKQRSEGKR
jgi:hypothetical protein